MKIRNGPTPATSALDVAVAGVRSLGANWGGDRLREDKCWKYGVPPAGIVNFPWVQQSSPRSPAFRPMCGGA